MWYNSLYNEGDVILNKYMVIAIITTVGIYLLFVFKNNVVWFINQINYTLKKKKDIQKLKKVNTNERRLNKEQIKKYIILSKKHLNDLNLSINRVFKIDKELERHLNYSKFSEKYLLELLNEIAKYINIDSSKIKLKINYISSQKDLEYAGL